MDLDAFSLKCFIKIAETKSFTKAAKHVGRTQSAISQQIAKLEALLGKELLVRGKMVTLTQDGEILLSYARKIFILQSEVIDRFREPELEGELRFGLPEDFATVFLSDVLVDFTCIHPRILLNVECDLTLNLFSRFKKNDFDLVLVKMNRPEEFPNGIEVWSESLNWVGDPRLIDSNKPVPLVLSSAPCVYRAAAIEALEKAGRAWRLVFTGSSYAGTIAAVKAGMGITVMPHTMIPKGLETVGFPLLPQLIDTHVSLLKHQSDQPAVNTLEKFVIEKLKR